MMYQRISVLLVIIVLLTGCTQASPTVIPTLMVPTTTDGAAPAPKVAGAVSASAEVVPAQVVELGFATAGMIKTIDAAEGDTVKAGDVLASQENTAQLQATLDAAQQNLASAQKALDSLTTNAPLSLATAQLAVVTDQKRYNDAVKTLKRKDYHRCDEETIDLYSQRFDEAKERLKMVQDNNDGTIPTLERLQEAQNVYNIAQANYLYCINYTEQEIDESNANLAVAEASLAQSNAHYALLKAQNGIDPDESARLQAAIASAQANLVTAQTALERATVRAPLDGMIISVSASQGESVVPGQAIFTLANINPLLIETTDLSERDISRVSVGQTAVVNIEALGKEFPAKVLKIAPRASKIGGDVVYKVTLQLNEQPSGLRWGMSATVQIGP